MKITLTISMVLLFMVFSNPAHAFSQTQCSIWLCLPAGFPSGCSDAYYAMKRRLRRGQSALPPLASCTISDKAVSKTQ